MLHSLMAWYAGAGLLWTTRRRRFWAAPLHILLFNLFTNHRSCPNKTLSPPAPVFHIFVPLPVDLITLFPSRLYISSHYRTNFSTTHLLMRYLLGSVPLPSTNGCDNAGANFSSLHCPIWRVLWNNGAIGRAVPFPCFFERQPAKTRTAVFDVNDALRRALFRATKAGSICLRAHQRCCRRRRRGALYSRHLCLRHDTASYRATLPSLAVTSSAYRAVPCGANNVVYGCCRRATRLRHSCLPLPFTALRTRRLPACARWRHTPPGRRCAGWREL